ncbi:MAG: flavodoxin family protein [Deltaproteobacteria bacterium]|nr:flavodoxin family protein [Deltaproteobacteria bacterium]
MKITVIDACIGLENDYMGLILTPFLLGVECAGATIKRIRVEKYHVKPCLRDLSCLQDSNGVCRQDDEMQKVLPVIAEADALVLVSQMGLFGLSGSLVLFLERLMPLVNPMLAKQRLQIIHPLLDTQKNKKVVLVSVSNEWSVDDFHPTLFQLMSICCKHGFLDFLGALIRPHVSSLMALACLGKKPQDIFDAAYDLGKSLASDQKLSQELLNTVSRPLQEEIAHVRDHNSQVAESLNGVRAKTK